MGRISIPEIGVFSVCCATQNLWLVARAEGVGVGWVSIISNEDLHRSLSLPQDFRPIAYLCLGYVNEFAEIPDLERAGWLPRLELSQVMCYEQWRKISAAFKKDDTISDTRLTESSEAYP